MSFASDLAADALGLLQEFGLSYTFSREATGSYSTTTRTAPLTPSGYTAYCVETDVNYGNKDTSLVQLGDRTFIAESYDYLVGDKITVGSDLWKIYQVRPIENAGVVVASYIDIRK